MQWRPLSALWFMVPTHVHGTHASSTAQSLPVQSADRQHQTRALQIKYRRTFTSRRNNKDAFIALEKDNEMPIRITQKLLGGLACRREDDKSNCTLVTQRHDSNKPWILNTVVHLKNLAGISFAPSDKQRQGEYYWNIILGTRQWRTLLTFLHL